MTDITRPALRYHGAKFRLAPWLLRFFPAHRIYVEPFGGAAGVLLRKQPSYAEVYNDLDDDIVNFFRVLRDPRLCERLVSRLRLTPYSRTEFEQAFEPTRDPVERARRTAIRAGMGFGSGGATKNRTGFRSDVRRMYGTAMMNWTDYANGLQAISKRLAEVVIECRPAVDVIRNYDGQDVLFFVDPPYVHSTRKMGSRVYRHEMTDDRHAELLSVLDAVKGMVLLSGYDSGLYAETLHGWESHCTESRISGGRGTTLRTETLWLNPACQRALKKPLEGLFA